ncbi:MAG TPA: flagellar basal body-associated FliL family protein [Desulfobacterales bacterium]|nr:flagellar basal body-associated FliL family protein [Desulfobacterales bacterium]
MSNKVMLILVGLLLVLVIALGGGLFMIYTKLPPASPKAVEPAPEAGAEAVAEKAKPEGIGAVVSMETFIVNLADPGGNRYLRVTMDLEMAGKPADKSAAKTAGDEPTKRMPQIRDAILMILSTKRFADISTPEGKSALREEILSAANGLLASSQITRIYFKEFVIQ